MTGDIDALAKISPFAAYLASFLSSVQPAWMLIFFAVALHWLFLLLPPVIALGYMDRKLGADIQMRIGPNRVGVFGIFQPVADLLKTLFKEELNFGGREPWLFRFGPVAAIVCVAVALGGVPMSESWVLSAPDAGIVFVMCALGLSQLWLFWAAYCSESAWSVLSGFRILAMTSVYLVPVAIALIPAVLVAGSTNLVDILHAQGGAPWRWMLFHNPGTLLSFGALFFGMLLWQGRMPLDFSTAREEVAGGLTAEYSGLRRGLLVFLENISFFLSCALVVTVYLGGSNTPFDLESFGRAASLVQWLFFTAKVFVLAAVSIWIRWSLPRLRIDQLVGLSWRLLVPAGLAGAAITALWFVLTHGRGMGDFL